MIPISCVAAFVERRVCSLGIMLCTVINTVPYFTHSFGVSWKGQAIYSTMWSCLGPKTHNTVMIQLDYHPIPCTVLYMYTSDWKVWKGIFLRWHCSDVRYLHLTCHLFVFVRFNSSQCHFILPRVPSSPSTQANIWSDRDEYEKREKKSIFTRHIPCPRGWQCSPFTTWVPEGIVLQPQYCVFKKLKEQRKEKLTCFHLFCLFDESEAGPIIIQYMMKCGDYIFFLLLFFFFLAKCEYSTYFMWNKRMLCVVDTKDVDAQNIKKGQLHMNSSWRTYGLYGYVDENSVWTGQNWTSNCFQPHPPDPPRPLLRQDTKPLTL